MAIRFYDEAITEKIKSWVKDSNLTILKPDESTRLFEKILDEKKDQSLTLPLIAISREKNIDILNTQKQPKTFEGFKLVQNEKTTIPINVIPIRLNYQLDIYTRYMSEADEYIRNFIFNLINYPKVTITLPYNDMNIYHNSIINLDPSITDNSDIKEHLFPDQFTRFTLKFSIDDAYLFSLPTKSNAQLELFEFNVEDRTSGKIVETDNIVEK